MDLRQYEYVVMNTQDLKEALKRKYPQPAYAILWEVGNATGMNCKRHADSLICSLWPSRGLTLTGCELKVSRSDWLKELQNPAKAEEIYQFCDYWCVVTGDEKIVRDGELPEGWGLLVPERSSLTIKVQPAKLQPNPVTRGFLAALFRKVCEGSKDSELLRRAEILGFEKGFASGKQQSSRMEHDYNDLCEKVRLFEEASGLGIRFGWERPEKIGQAVRAYLSGQHKQPEERLKTIRSVAEGILKLTDTVLTPIVDAEK